MPAVLTSIAAQIFVADIDVACEFYVAKLGFTIVFTYGEPPYYGQLRRDAARITLRRQCGLVFVGDIREREELLSATIMVATKPDIETLFADYTASGIEFRQTLQLKPWGPSTSSCTIPPAT